MSIVTLYKAWTATEPDLYVLRSTRVQINHAQQLADDPPVPALQHSLLRVLKTHESTALRLEALRTFELLLRFDLVPEEIVHALCSLCLMQAGCDPCNDIRRWAARALRTVLSRSQTILSLIPQLPEYTSLCKNPRLTPLEVEELVVGIRNQCLPPPSATLPPDEFHPLTDLSAWTQLIAQPASLDAPDSLVRWCEKLADAVDPDQSDATARTHTLIAAGVADVVLGLFDARDGVRVPAFKAAIGLAIGSQDPKRAGTLIDSIEKLYESPEDWFEDWVTGMIMQLYSYFPNEARQSALIDRLLERLPRYVGYRLPDYVWWITERLVWASAEDRELFNSKGCLRPLLEIYREACLSELMAYRWVDQAYDEIEAALGRQVLRKETARLLGFCSDWSRPDKRSHLVRRTTLDQRAEDS